ncbi:MAG: S8 family serine peptidase, partial [Alphaproteobacteria bacterium]|nr:S8 family serine peptidase [Alphaproteobacteria bacterium]
MKNTPLMRLQARAQFFALCAAALLAGCGGGGGASSEATAQSPQTPQTQTGSVAVAAPGPKKLLTPDDAGFAARKAKYEETETYRAKPYLRSYTRYVDPEISGDLLVIGAHAAYARGATGKGEVVALTDTLVQDDHIEFAGDGKITMSGLQRAHYCPGYKTSNPYFGPSLPSHCVNPNVNATSSHGTRVASVIAGGRDGKRGTEYFHGSLGHVHYNMQGVAFDAGLHAHQIDLDTNRLITTDISELSEADDKEIARRYFTLEHARAGGAAIINHSFTWGAPIHEYDKKQVREKYKHTAAAMEQKGVDPADKIIVVRAAGNRANFLYLFGSGADSPDLMSGLGVAFPELKNHVLAVVGADKAGIDLISNRCGVAKDFCIAAPSWLDTAEAGSMHRLNLYSEARGTSFAAPLVSGGLALLRQYFRDDDGTRQLGNTELVARLLATADKTGIYADSDTFGHGMMDLDAATAPYGALATSLSTDPNAQPFDASAFSLSGNAFGGA